MGGIARAAISIGCSSGSTSGETISDTSNLPVLMCPERYT
jgi:hypothetical protein